MATIYAHPTLMQNKASLRDLTREAGLVVVARFSQKGLQKAAQASRSWRRPALVQPDQISLVPADQASLHPVQQAIHNLATTGDPFTPPPTFPGGDAA